MLDSKRLNSWCWNHSIDCLHHASKCNSHGVLNPDRAGVIQAVIHAVIQVVNLALSSDAVRHLKPSAPKENSVLADGDKESLTCASAQLRKPKQQIMVVPTY